MTFPSLFGSNKKHVEIRTTQPLTTNNPALHLPEILSIIFSFLSQKTLSTSVRFVCKQWLAVVRPMIHVQGLWKDRTHQKYSHRFLLNRLHTVTHLRVLFESIYTHNNTLYAWNELGETIDSLRDNNKLRISHLIINGANFLESRIYTILPKVTTLTEIRIERTVQRTIHLGVILALCPSLRRLYMEYPLLGNNHLIEDNTIPPWKGTETESKRSRIEIMSIKGMNIEQESLESIVDRCSSIKVMKFIGVIQNPPLVTCFDKARFYRKLVTSCLELECFHFSMQGEHMDPPEARILTNTFFPGTQFNKSIATNGGSQCKVMEDKQASRPTLSTMSITDSDVRNENVLHLFKPFMDPFYNKILTTLEIVPAVGTSSHHIGHIFHNFLCSASTLQHLIAPMIPYDAEYLDLGSTVPGEEGYYSPRSCRTGQRISENARIKRQIWACHGLLTLKIQFKSMTVDSPMAENARIMFGYISRACPKLKVLSIYRQVLDLRLDGGFCLLTRLRYLKTLTIETGTNIVLKARDVEWMARYPKKSKLSWLSSSRSGTGNSPTSSSTGINTTSGISRTNSTRSKSSTKSSYYGSETKEDVSLEPTLDDFKELGLITDVEACRRQILMAQSEQDCWTRLEFLGIKVGKLKSEREDNLDSLIESLRPDIEFSRDPRHW